MVATALWSGAACVGAADVVEPEPASWDDLALVHTPEYLEKTRTAAASAPPTSRYSSCRGRRRSAECFRLMTGGTMLAARLASRPGARARPPRRASARRGAARRVREHRRRTSPRVPGPRRGLLPVQRRGGRDPRAPARRRRAPRGGDRRGRAPGQRHGLHLRGRPVGLHVLDPPGAQLPERQAPAGRSTSACPTARTTGSTCRRSNPRCRRSSRSGPISSSTSRAPIRSWRISWADCA